jgi:hypothetical protein
MLTALRELILYRLIGGRLLLALAIARAAIRFIARRRSRATSPRAFGPGERGTASARGRGAASS